MLFALGFDRFWFKQIPGAMSIMGSTLILGSAIYMAMQRDSGSPERITEGAATGQTRDEEVGLMATGEEDEDGSDDDGRSDIRMRSLR